MTIPTAITRETGAAWSVWLNHHRRGLTHSLARAVRRPWATLLTVIVMALALALPLGLSIAVDNLKQFSGSVQQSRDIHVFLKPGLEAGHVAALATELSARADVAAVITRSPDEGLAELRQAAGLGEAIDALGSNPLPSVLVVTPAQEDDAALISALQALAQSDEVQHDAQWRRRLDSWLHFGQRLVQVLAVIFGLGAVLVVGNTVRLDLQSRREEIGVLQLLGATDGFIRRPFLYLGAWYGLGAGALALGLVGLCAVALRAPLAALASSYGSTFALAGLSMASAAVVVLITTLLGWMGAWLVASYVLRQTRPTET